MPISISVRFCPAPYSCRTRSSENLRSPSLVIVVVLLLPRRPQRWKMRLLLPTFTSASLVQNKHLLTDILSEHSRRQSYRSGLLCLRRTDKILVPEEVVKALTSKEYDLIILIALLMMQLRGFVIQRWSIFRPIGLNMDSALGNLLFVRPARKWLAWQRCAVQKITACGEKRDATGYVSVLRMKANANEYLVSCSSFYPPNKGERSLSIQQLQTHAVTPLSH